MPGDDPDQEIDVDLTLLPHWARVAFAARCARQVYPLFVRCWPKANSRRTDAVQLAIELAERSSAEGRAIEGLDSAMVNAVRVAGAALSVVYGFASDEPGPADSDSAVIASLVANVAKDAAKAAQSDPMDSTQPAREAYSFAEDAASNASSLKVLIEIDRDFVRLYRASLRGRWNDRTAVPSTLFTD